MDRKKLKDIFELTKLKGVGDSIRYLLADFISTKQKLKTSLEVIEELRKRMNMPMEEITKIIAEKGADVLMEDLSRIKKIDQGCEGECKSCGSE